VLARLKADESAGVLRSILERHPDLAAEAEEIAKATVTDVDGEAVAEEVEQAVLDLDDLKEFYGRIKAKGQPIDHIADHGISLGIYLRDPDGNGVEVYYEMPRAEWPVDYHVFSRDKVGRGRFPGPWDAEDVQPLPVAQPVAAE